MLNNRMKRLRLARGLTQEQVAELMHMEQPTYSRMERGYRKATAEELELFCSIMETTIAVFMGDAEVPAEGTGNGAATNGVQKHTPPIDEHFYRDMLERKDRQIEESHNLLRSMIEVVKTSLEQLRRKARGGGGGKVLTMSIFWKDPAYVPPAIIG